MKNKNWFYQFGGLAPKKRCDHFCMRWAKDASKGNARYQENCWSNPFLPYRQVYEQQYQALRQWSNSPFVANRPAGHWKHNSRPGGQYRAERFSILIVYSKIVN